MYPTRVSNFTKLALGLGLLLVAVTVNAQTCTPLTGATAPIARMRINYGCGDDAHVAGSVDRSRPLWRVFYGTPNRSLSLQQVAVTTAWY